MKEQAGRFRRLRTNMKRPGSERPWRVNYVENEIVKPELRWISSSFLFECFVGGPTQNVYSLDLAACYLSPNDNLLRQLKTVLTTLNRQSRQAFFSPVVVFFFSPVLNAVICEIRRYVVGYGTVLYYWVLFLSFVRSRKPCAR